MALDKKHTRMHDIWEIRVGKRMSAGVQPEGVAVMAPRGFGTVARNVYVPNDKAMEGRVMTVHFRSKLFDVMVVSMYCHVGDRAVERQRKTERLYDWCRQLHTRCRCGC